MYVKEVMADDKAQARTDQSHRPHPYSTSAFTGPLLFSPIDGSPENVCTEVGSSYEDEQTGTRVDEASAARGWRPRGLYTGYTEGQC